ncbi:MAG: hypothetical protein VW338_06895 [Rhodospirillaceae bacterium]
MAELSPLHDLNPADADVRISVPKQEEKEMISSMPEAVVIDPKTANQKPRQEKISRSANRVVESDDWRKDTKAKIWKWHKQPVVYLNCSRDVVTLRTYNLEDAVRMVPRWSTKLKPGERTKGVMT